MTKKLISYTLALGFFFSSNVSVFAQKENGLFLKTNLTNLVFKMPTIGLEKRFNEHAIELSFVSGKADQFIHYSDYGFAGGLLRYKKHKETLFKQVEYYYGGYFGYLYRNYQVDFGRYYTNDYAGGTIRSGISSGFATYPFKGKMIIDFQTSVGYGRNLASHDLKQYLDLQFWLSIGFKLK